MLQLFQNLLGNALKFYSERPLSINIQAQQEPSATQISISDNGIGMKMTYAKEIIDIFRRLHTRQEYEGTGIGLAICHRVIENHDGVIWVESQVDVGTTFTFRLPQTMQPEPSSIIAEPA